MVATLIWHQDASSGVTFTKSAFTDSHHYRLHKNAKIIKVMEFMKTIITKLNHNCKQGQEYLLDDYRLKKTPK